MVDLVANYNSVKDRIAAACQKSNRNVADVQLVAVSKRKPMSDILQLYHAGHRDFGENYVQELIEKAQECPKDIRWHFIGSLQSNKAKMLCKIPNLFAVESVDSIKIADALSKAMAKERDSGEVQREPLQVFIQVNTSGEESKGGVEPSQLLDVATHIMKECPQLTLRGLMTIGSREHSLADGTLNPDFECLLKCKQDLQQALQMQENVPNLRQPIQLQLSMGMSSDYEHAIEMQSNQVRVGSTIFGARQ
ncbi:hypothetical protein MIR68_007539 [Amoeboaphelidium protococcarum]|nr:hypothetical protein MIR68_007539 [Amoeboaphelidium protococcarum]